MGPAALRSSRPQLVDCHRRSPGLDARHRQGSWNPNGQSLSPFRFQRSASGRAAPEIPRRPRPGGRPRASKARRPVVTSRVRTDRGPRHRDRAVCGSASRCDPDLDVRDPEFEPGADQMDAAPSGGDLGGGVPDLAGLSLGRLPPLRRRPPRSGGPHFADDAASRARRLTTQRPDGSGGDAVVPDHAGRSGRRSPVGRRAEPVGRVHRRGSCDPKLDE